MTFDLQKYLHEYQTRMAKEGRSMIAELRGIDDLEAEARADEADDRERDRMDGYPREVGPRYIHGQ